MVLKYSTFRATEIFLFSFGPLKCGGEGSGAAAPRSAAPGSQTRPSLEMKRGDSCHLNRRCAPRAGWRRDRRFRHTTSAVPGRAGFDPERGDPRARLGRLEPGDASFDPACWRRWCDQAQRGLGTSMGLQEGQGACWSPARREFPRLIVRQGRACASRVSHVRLLLWNISAPRRYPRLSQEHADGGFADASEVS